MTKRIKFQRYIYSIFDMDNDLKAKIMLDWFDSQPKYYPLWYIIHYKFTGEVINRLFCEYLQATKQSQQGH